MSDTNQNSALNHEILRQFTGTEQWYRHPIFRNSLYTDGVKFVAEQGGAYWLLDKILASQAMNKLTNEPFQVWDLTCNEGGEGAKLKCTDGNDNFLFEENITYTDFPLQSIRFFFTDNVLLLPSEY